MPAEGSEGGEGNEGGGGAIEKVYSVRLTDRADGDRAAMAAWIIENAALDEEGNPTPEGERMAEEWLRGLSAALASLRHNPTGPPVLAAETRRAKGLPLRRILYRPNPGSRMVHQVYYTVQEDSPDGPRVAVVHIRGAHRKPLTAKEAQAFRGEL